MSVVKVKVWVSNSSMLPKGRFGFFKSAGYSLFSLMMRLIVLDEILKLGNASLAWGKTSAWIATSIFISKFHHHWQTFFFVATSSVWLSNWKLAEADIKAKRMKKIVGERDNVRSSCNSTLNSWVTGSSLCLLRELRYCRMGDQMRAGNISSISHTRTYSTQIGKSPGGGTRSKAGIRSNTNKTPQNLE